MWWQRLAWKGKQGKGQQGEPQKETTLHGEFKPRLSDGDHIFAVIVSFRIAGLCQVLRDLGALARARIGLADEHRILLDRIQNLVFVLKMGESVVLVLICWNLLDAYLIDRQQLSLLAQWLVLIRTEIDDRFLITGLSLLFPAVRRQNCFEDRALSDREF